MKLVRTIKPVICAFLFASVWSLNAAAQAQIHKLDWMTGHWTGFYQGLPMEAQYSSSNGGMILGMTKIANGTTTEFFEFEQIAEENGALVLRPFPFGTKGVEFPLKEMTSQRAIFENPTHEFPTRIIYELKTSGELLARIEGMKNGQAVSDEFIFSRAQ